MQMQNIIINQKEIYIKSEPVIITTLLVKTPDGLSVEYWYNIKDYACMHMIYGGMLADEIEHNPNLEPDITYIIECIAEDIEAEA